MEYFKVAKDCGDFDCVPQEDPSTVYKNLVGEEASAGIGGEGQFVLLDGTFINIQNTTGFTGKVIIVYDVNGYKKAPNKYGVDTFSIDINGEVINPSGATSTYFENHCNTSSNREQDLGCTKNVLINKDY